MRWFVLLAVGSLSGSCVFGGDLPRKVKPVVVWTGTDSKQTKASFARCCSQEDWKASWRRHRGRDEDLDDQPCPEVDFECYMVIVIFGGSSPRIGIPDVVEERDCVRVRYKPSWGQIVFVPLQDGTVKVIGQNGREIELEKASTQSFAFVVLSRFSQPIVLEENVQNLISGPPVWKERAKFPALVKE